ncbi:conserved hypothetical protein [Gammaproteobacteria bacterium]
MRRPLILGVVSILVALLPFIVPLIDGPIANLNHCVLNEGGVNTCVMMDIDFGETLYVMVMSFWFFYISAPIGAVGFLISVFWFLAILVTKWWHR